ncbi:IS701 family transposase [Nonomuraea fuscirosea]|uniref:IS701 family transposase n=1 Tax=Nonomuraea fuscirosea TaxID=1291556 RepID=UPI002DD92336|nr:IS701 family transposase [Nonomuraea fuscirosea]WSA58211.1 IS701 family transposase [Nonomuraea fuscirosea]WSA58571.1 IS701 family transposase [Nonomuraea fuscirosea]WSA58586.1 IS701 family transposase [Nonomuraea fuscirosea]
MARIAGRFGRVEPRRAVTAYVRGLLADLDRKNCWNLAEHAGLGGPQVLQRLLRTARWDADKVRDDVRDFVVDRLGPGGVLIADETGFLKKGAGSAGVQRQYSGTAGRIENCQIGVFLAYATPAGRALLDRRLYLPEHTWMADPDRCRAAGVPDEIAFATKPALATAMMLAALEAGVPAHWLTGDEVYGQDPRLRAALEERRMGYVLAIAGNRRIELEGVQVSAAEVAARVADRHWHRYRAGQGAKGPRWYAWAWARIDEGEAQGYRWLLIRRNLTTGELAFYRCYAPARQPLMALVKIAGIRWAVEESFQAAKGQVGLDHYQVRGWTAWHRHVTLAMLALALLAAIAAVQPSDTTEDRIPLTLPEIRRLLATLLLTRHRSTTDVLRWSDWRRRHQAIARRCHYQRRSKP